MMNFVLGEVVSDRDATLNNRQDRIRMILQAIRQTRLLKWLLTDDSESHDLILMAIYVSEKMTVERYLFKYSTDSEYL